MKKLIVLLMCALSLAAFLQKAQAQRPQAAAPTYTLDEALALFPDGTSGYLATIKGDHPELREFQCQLREGNKFYFVTSNTKDVYKQLTGGVKASFACRVPENMHVRISGKVTIVTDKAEKQRLFDKLPQGMKNMYGSTDNPALAIFSLSEGEYKISKGMGPYQTLNY